MTARYQIGLILRASLLAFTCVVFTGCQSFDFGAAPTETATTSPPVTDANVIGQYQMQLIPARGEPSVEKVNITSPVTVQDALEASGATKKFKDMKISLGRIIKDNGTLLKLPIDYQVRSKLIRPEQNYQLLPGDTLTVSPKSTDAFEKMIKSLMGNAS